MQIPLKDPGEMNFIEEYDRTHEAPSMELIGMFMEDAMNREAGKVAPDTAGADYFFLKEFVNESMRQDFSYIERDFLKHCSDKLSEFYNAAWYGDDMTYDSSPEESVCRKIMVMIFNGAKLGDSYCHELIKYLYKTYHKKEYNQLKRFKIIDVQEIFSLAELPDDECDYVSIGRIMGMCCFMGIRLSEKCSLLYLMLNREREKWEAEDEELLEFEGFREGLLEECIQTVDAWRDADEDDSSKSFPHKEYWEDECFVGACFRQHGYPAGYEYGCRNAYTDLRMDLARTLAMLKTIYPKEEFTHEDVQHYAQVYSMIDALAQVSDSFDEHVERLLGVDNYSVEDDGESLYKPENIIVREKIEKVKQNEPVNVAPISMGNAETEDYLAEIAMLRKKLHEKEQENKYLREMNRNARNAEKESQELINKLQSDREELIALREYAYKSKWETEPAAEVKLEEMTAAIAEKNVVIIGGHVNWIQKLKQLFPKWLFVHPDMYRTVDGKMLENKEHVYFFTDYLNHVSYKKFIAVLREKKIPFGYLGCVNVESVVRRVFEELGAGENRS